MNFIDHTGHTFTLNHFDVYPYGHDMIDHQYTFWMDGYVDGRKLSTDNWYCKPVWMLLDINEEIEYIEMKSSIFYLGLYSDLKVMNGKTISDSIDLQEEDIKNLFHNGILYIDDPEYVLVGNKKLFPVYFFAFSNNEGTFSTDVLVKTKDRGPLPAATFENPEESYIPFAISGEWHDEVEELVVNGKNMGITLPKEVLKAVYDTTFFSDVPDNVLYARKLKEALLEYMSIKGECGNYNSAINSLKWFGYGDKIDFVKLMRTDNEFLATYIRDSFDINNDMLDAFSSFNNSSFVSLYIKENQEMEEVDWPVWDREFYGEGKPFLEDLFMKVIPVKHDEGDILFWKPFYDWNFNEMALKISWLSQVWKKYFLPIHLNVMSASINRLVFANDIKHVTKVGQKLTATPVSNWSDCNLVKFPASNLIYIYNQEHYIDGNFNEMTDYKTVGEETDEQIMYINDICASIPLEFICHNDEEWFDVNFIITSDGHKIYESKFQFAQMKDKPAYKSFILSPNYIVNNTGDEKIKKYGMSYWIDRQYRLTILCNGRWYYWDFVLKVPEFQLGVGTLKYNYFTTISQEDTQNTETFEEWLERNGYKLEDVDTDNVMNKEIMEKWMEYSQSSVTMKSMFTQIESITDNSINFNSFMYVPSLVEVNDICFYPKLQDAMNLASGSSAAVTSYTEYMKYLATKCYVYDFGLTTYRDKWVVGNSVVPVFKFNNGIELGNLGNGFDLTEFYVDIYFDIDTDNTYYAKLTYNLDELKELTKDTNYVLARHLKSYAAISDAVLVMLKSKLGLDSKGPVYNYEEGKQTINWDATSLDWRQFYIDDYEKTRRQITIRIVYRGVISGPSGTTYKFGGYDSKMNPKEGYFYEERLNVSSDSSKYCEMECTSFCKGLCKFRKENTDALNPGSDGKSYDYDYTADDAAEDDGKVQEIMSEVTKKNLENILKSEMMKVKIQDNNAYLNQIHIYDIYEGRKKLKYNEADNVILNSDGTYIMPQSLIDRYREFFEDDGKQKVYLKGDDDMFEYDFYLMHDDTQWFAVFISKMTISNSSSDDDLEGPDKIKFDKYTLKKYRSGKKFLINRMMYYDAAPEYKFDSDDLIITTIDNVNFPYILDKSTKWSISPFSLGMNNISNIESTTNSAIFSVDKKTSGLISGYYDVYVRYSVDSNVNHQQIKKRRILIK